MSFDPKYRMKFRPTPISRLSKYEHPLPMTGNPPKISGLSWEERCRVVYEHMISLKRRGLWFYSEQHHD